jgi:single-strand DNA-binding protein
VARIDVGLALSGYHRDEPEDVALAFVDLVAFSHLAENIAASLAKGDRVVVTGELEEAPDTGTDGSDHPGARLIARDVAVSLRFTEVQVPRAERRAVQPR